MPKFYFLALLLALAGCATRPPTRLAVPAGYCDPPLPYRYNLAFAPQTDFEAALTPALLARYPRRNLLTANAVGILPALRELLALQAAEKRQPGPATEVAVLRLRQRIASQVALVSSTVASLAAELDCEGERADQVAGYLKTLDDHRTQRLNVLSISVGAASGIGTTLLDNRGAQYSFGIGGGLLAAGLGLLTLRQSGHKVEFLHPRNLLAEVWKEQPAPDLFPPSVWYLLTNPAFSNGGQTSILYNTRQRWQRYGQLAQTRLERGQSLGWLALRARRPVLGRPAHGARQPAQRAAIGRAPAQPRAAKPAGGAERGVGAAQSRGRQPARFFGVIPRNGRSRVGAAAAFTSLFPQKWQLNVN